MFDCIRLVFELKLKFNEIVLKYTFTSEHVTVCG